MRVARLNVKVGENFTTFGTPRAWLVVRVALLRHTTKTQRVWWAFQIRGHNPISHNWLRQGVFVMIRTAETELGGAFKSTAVLSLLPGSDASWAIVLVRCGDAMGSDVPGIQMRVEVT